MLAPVMDDDPNTAPAPRSDELRAGRLDSWKEIAAYLGRGIRTVQRWEREEGLPVHRLAHEKRGSIYARREELAAWWESRRLTLATPESADAVDAPAAPRLERVTWTSAMTTWPALSSDARLIAYVSDAGQDGTTPQIWIQQIGGAALRLTNGEREYSHLSFSPDDTRIIFTASDEFRVRMCTRFRRLEVNRGSCSEARAAARFRPMVAGSRPFRTTAAGIRVAARGGAGFRTVASELVDVACATWLPDSRSVIVHARPGPALEADWWIVPIDGGPPTSTGVVRLFREARMFTVPTGVAWVDDSLVFSAAGAQGVSLYRQRIVPSTFQPAGAPERLTEGSEAAWLPTAAAGRLAFLSSRADSNLWSVALDPASGVAHGPLRRMTRGPGISGSMSVTSDFRTLAYFSFRLGTGRGLPERSPNRLREGAHRRTSGREGVSGDFAKRKTTRVRHEAGGRRARGTADLRRLFGRRDLAEAG